MSDTANVTQKYRQTHKELRDEYQSEGWEQHHEELQRFFSPRKGIFVDRDNDTPGAKKNKQIINSRPIGASNTLASGMMAGITSPTRPWFSLSTEDRALKEFGPVKNWLEGVRRIMLETFNRSNVYKVLHGQYRDLGVYGTSAMSIEFDLKDVIRAYPFPIGSFVAGLNDRLETEIFYNEVKYNVAQVVQKFGLENCSDSVKAQYKNGNLTNITKVIHGIEINNLRNFSSSLSKDLPYKSVWYEKNASGNKFLQDSGFHEFPVMVPRWMVNGTESYGSSPGMDTLGINKSLQLKEKRKNTLIDKLTDPPMIGPASLQQSYASLISGEITYIETGVNAGKFEPAQKVEPTAIRELREDIYQQATELDEAFFVDLFLMLSNSDRRQMTATEVAERHEEKLLMLGPVLENIHNDLLDPLIDRTFNILLRNGLIPPAPQELSDVELKVEYISILAQAQRAVGLGSIRETMSFAAEAAQFSPDSLDKIDFDQVIDEVADMNGTPPSIIRSDEAVAKRRKDREEAARAQQAAAALPEAANTAKTLSETPMGQDGGNALEKILGGAAGV